MPLADGYAGDICSNSDKQVKIICCVCCSLQKEKKIHNPPTPSQSQYNTIIIWPHVSEKLILTLKLPFTSQTLYILSVKRNPSLFCNLRITTSECIILHEYLDKIRMPCIFPGYFQGNHFHVFPCHVLVAHQYFTLIFTKLQNLLDPVNSAPAQN